MKPDIYSDFLQAAFMEASLKEASQSLYSAIWAGSSTGHGLSITGIRDFECWTSARDSYRSYH